MPVNSKINKNKAAWYHCGRCGSLFQSHTHMTRIRFCSECGLNPKPSMVSISSQAETHLENFKDIKEKSSSSNKHRKKNISFKKISHLTIGIAVVWWLIAGLIIYSAKTIWPDKIQQKSTPTYDSKKIDNHANLALEKENLLLINRSVEGCMQTLKDFFQATLPEERNQHVIQSFDSPIRIERYHNIENLNLASPPTLEHSQWSVVNIAEEKAIEATWTNDEGRRFEAIFRKQREEWLIDWEHFVRYSDMPLAVFLSGNGDAEGEFRLLARERLAEERKDLPTISIMFYAPIFG